MEDRRHKLQSCFEHIVIPNSCDSQELVGSKPDLLCRKPQKKDMAHTPSSVRAQTAIVGIYIVAPPHWKTNICKHWELQSPYSAHGKHTKSNVDASVQRQAGH